LINRKSISTIVYTGGGTAGHVYPGLAVITEMNRLTGETFRHCWIGSDRGMDKTLVENAGVVFYGIPAGKLRRYMSVKNVLDIFKIAAGLIRALFLLGRLKPAAVFSKGGYVTVPVVFAARMLGVPVVSHESDAEPGLATRINSRFSRRILVSFEESPAFFPPSARDRIEISGNPVRSELFLGDAAEGSKKAGPGTKPLLLVLGGSQGARQINELIAACRAELLQDWRIVHQAGSWDALPDPVPGYSPRTYIGQELADLLAAARLVVCRAGASTLWELAALGKPSVLIPLGTASSRGDQQSNARIFASRGASVVLTGDVSPGRLLEEVSALLKDPGRLERMSRAAEDLANREAGAYISNVLLKEIQTYGRTGNN